MPCFSKARTERSVETVLITVRLRPSSLGQLLFKALGFVMSRESIDERSNLAIHHLGELVDGQANTMVGHAVLRIIVGTDLFGAVPCFDLSAALRKNGGLLLFEFHFIQARTQDAHGLATVLDLRFFVLLRDDEAARNVRYTHGGVRGIDRLAAWS